MKGLIFILCVILCITFVSAKPPQVHKEKGIYLRQYNSTYNSTNNGTANNSTLPPNNGTTNGTTPTPPPGPPTGGPGFADEYNKFDYDVQNWVMPAISVHIANLKKAVPMRAVVDLEYISQYGTGSILPNCVNDVGATVTCEYDFIDRETPGTIVDVVVRLPWQNYPHYSENIENDNENDPELDQRQLLLDDYTNLTESAISEAVNASNCSIIYTNRHTVGYTTRYAYHIGIECPDDKIYRTVLCTNPKFYLNIFESVMADGLDLESNLASTDYIKETLKQMGLDDAKSSKYSNKGGNKKNKMKISEEEEEIEQKFEQLHTKSNLNLNLNKLSKRNSTNATVACNYYSNCTNGTTYNNDTVNYGPQDPYNGVSISTRFNYNSAHCGGVWYKDFLDGRLDGRCIEGSCDFIKNKGESGIFILIDTGVDFDHKEFESSRLGPMMGRKIIGHRVVPRSVTHKIMVQHQNSRSRVYRTRKENKNIWRKSLNELRVNAMSMIAKVELDTEGHGTALAAILVGDTLGIAKDAQLWSYNPSNRGDLITSMAARAINLARIRALEGRTLIRKPTMIVTGYTFIFSYKDCKDKGWRCAIKLVAAVQAAIKSGITMVTAAGNGILNVRDFCYPPQGMNVPEPFYTGYDACHWARYLRNLNPWSDTSWNNTPSYSPMMILNGHEGAGNKYKHNRPIRITGFTPQIKMIPFENRRAHPGSRAGEFVDVGAFNYGDRNCIDYAAPGSGIERLATIRNMSYDDALYLNIPCFLETGPGYPSNTAWIAIDVPKYNSTGKIFNNGYKVQPYTSSGTSFSAPIGAAAIMSALITNWNVLKPTTVKKQLTLQSSLREILDNGYVVGTYKQSHPSFNISYTGLKNLNKLWNINDTETEYYEAMKTPSFKPLKMRKINANCNQYN